MKVCVCGGGLRDPPQGTAGGDIPGGMGRGDPQRAETWTRQDQLGTNPDITKGGKFRFGLGDSDPILFFPVLFFSPTSSQIAPVPSKESYLCRNLP